MSANSVYISAKIFLALEHFSTTFLLIFICQCLPLLIPGGVKRQRFSTSEQPCDSLEPSVNGGESKRKKSPQGSSQSMRLVQAGEERLHQS